MNETSRPQNESSKVAVDTVESVDSGSRTIYVHDVPDQLADVLEMWFESPKHDGGAVDKFFFDVSSHVAVVTFADVQGRKTC